MEKKESTTLVKAIQNAQKDLDKKEFSEVIKTTFDSLRKDELVNIILPQLPVKDLLSICQVSKKMNTYCKDPIVWVKKIELLNSKNKNFRGITKKQVALIKEFLEENKLSLIKLIKLVEDTHIYRRDMGLVMQLYGLKNNIVRKIIEKENYQILEPFLNMFDIEALNLSKINTNHDLLMDNLQILLEKNMIGSLFLAENHLSALNIIQLAEALEDNESLVELNLSFNIIDNEAATALSDAIEINNTLETLSVYRTNIDDDIKEKMSKKITIYS